MSTSRDTAALELPSRRGMVAGPVVAVVTFVAALVATHVAGVPLRDPDHVAGGRLVGALGLVLALVALDIAVRATLRSETRRPSWSGIRAVRRERWGWYRGLAAGGALVSFYVSYLAYRNIKSVVPLLRPGDLFDHDLDDFDRALFAGHDPGDLLHSLLGTGLQTQVLSIVYLSYLVVVPLLVAFTLVHSRNLRGGLFFVTAMAINWPLGAASYLLLPSVGPVFALPLEFVHLPVTGATHLQGLLLDQRLSFLHDPQAPGRAQGIAAFASLHVSMLFTAAAGAQLLGLGRRVRVALWTLLGTSTVATIYLGWHYFADDLAGVVIAVAALSLARCLTGIDLGAARRSRDDGSVGRDPPEHDTGSAVTEPRPAE